MTTCLKHENMKSESFVVEISGNVMGLSMNGVNLTLARVATCVKGRGRGGYWDYNIHLPHSCTRIEMQSFT